VQDQSKKTHKSKTINGEKYLGRNLMHTKKAEMYAVIQITIEYIIIIIVV